MYIGTIYCILRAIYLYLKSGLTKITARARDRAIWRNLFAFVLQIYNLLNLPLNSVEVDLDVILVIHTHYPHTEMQ